MIEPQTTPAIAPKINTLTNPMAPSNGLIIPSKQNTIVAARTKFLHGKGSELKKLCLQETQ